MGLDVIRARERRTRPEDRAFSLPLEHKLKQGQVVSLNHPPSINGAQPVPRASTTLLRRIRARLLFWWQRLDFWLVQYPTTDRRNEENLTPLPASPDVGHSNRVFPNRSSGFALGILATILVFLAWAVGLFSKPLGTAFGGSVVLVGMGVAVANFMRQGRTLVLPMHLQTPIPNSVLAVLMSNEKDNKQVIESALQGATSTQPVVFLYLSDQRLERVPQPFEIVDPYLEDVEAKETFRQAERLASRERVARFFVYQLATPEKLEQVWKFVRPRDVVLPEALIDQTEGINPDRLRYELTSNSRVAHLVKNW